MSVFPARRIFIMADPYTPKNMARLLNGLSWEVAQGAPLTRHHVKADMALPMPVCATQFPAEVHGSDPMGYLPPVVSRNAPVTKDASELASHKIARATSSACPPRPIGMLSFKRSTRSGSPPLACISV